MESHPKYRIYPSLLDKFQELLDYEKVAEEDWNKDSDGEYKLTPDEMYLKIESELINSINRCPREPSEAADKGNAFNEIVDCLIENRKSRREDCKIYSIKNGYGEKIIRAEINGFTFDYDVKLCKDTAEFFAGSLTQFFAESVMETAHGDVEIYGFIDEWPNNLMFDIKTTGRYTFGKFENKWQRHAYPWCVINSGLATEIESFTYFVIEWAYQRAGEPLKAKSVTQETYTYDHHDSGIKLRDHIERFIDWLESRREFIQDKKIFGFDNPEDWHGTHVDIEKLKQVLLKKICIMGYKIKGRVTVLTPTKSMTAKSGNAYQSRYLVITAIRYDQYTGQPTEDQENTPKFTFFGKQCEALDNIKIGDIVTVNFDIQGRAFDKDGQRDYFTEVRPFRVDCDNSNQISPTQPQNNSGNQYPNFYAPGCAAYPRPAMGYSQQQISENNHGSQQYDTVSSQAPQAYQPPIQPNSTPFGQSTFPPAPNEVQGKTEDLPF